MLLGRASLGDAAHTVKPVGGALLERDAELEQLAALVDRAVSGSGAAAALVGPAGIGKTSLMRAASAHGTEHGLECLSAGGGELERDFAFGVVRQLFERPLRALTPAERTTVLDGAARPAAAVLGLDGEHDRDVSSSPFEVVHALYWMCANLAERGPLLLAIDDLHWADAPSLRFLAYLARRIQDVPLVALVASRPAQDTDRAQLIEAITMTPEVRTIHLSPLSEAAVTAVVNANLGREADRELVRSCWEATGGNPFLCNTLASTIAEQGLEAPGVDNLGSAAETVARLVVGRLGHLPDDAGALVKAVAILGTNADLRHAAALSALDDRAAAAAADALVAQGILSVGRRLEFVHPLVRAAVREQVPPAERLLAHARAARMLDSAGVSTDAVAAHLMAAEPERDAWAVERLREAARSATRRGAPETAARYLRRALQEPPPGRERAGVLFELGATEVVLGELSAAADHLVQARELTEDVSDRAQIARTLANAISASGRYEDAVALLTETLAEVRGADADLEMAIEGQRLALACLAPGGLAAAADDLRRLGLRPTGPHSGRTRLPGRAQHDRRPGPHGRAGADPRVGIDDRSNRESRRMWPSRA